ncbi:uncharacterized protein si:dkeyp-117h8.4 isoform X2 [Pseudoliparis swirei]|uniref:uncharacterized protein si:dkeyp-117h8.4 isoform X2 n=1 Tax=Pseudoliparis swirei TaxID=2059687 RepID=UPI0024BDC292|nr:uncharacterized protein si:dkeyp-117h8.4 isoform X2 [Pseudoliparis swirei]
MSNMDDLFKNRLYVNGSNFKSAMERIIEKYSKLQYQDGGMEVDVGSTEPRRLERYMRLSRVEISKLESKSLTDLREESIRAPDFTRDSQLDFTYEDGGADETRASTTQMSAQDHGMSTNDSTGLTASSPDESSRDISATSVQTEDQTEDQPEDRDEELELSLSSHGSSLLELYPDMIDRIGRVWRRQHVSEAAGSVLRRYRRWRRRSGRGGLGNTFVVTRLRAGGGYPENDTSLMLLEEQEEETRNSPKKRQFIGDVQRQSPLRRVNHVQQQSPLRVDHVQQQSPLRVNHVQQQSPLRRVSHVQQQSPLKGVTHVQQQSPVKRVKDVQQQSPWRVRGEQQPVLVMDLSGPSETFVPGELNETFTVSEESGLGGRASACSAGPTRPPRPRRLSLQADLHPAYAAVTAGETGDAYGSPVRRSPSRRRVGTSLGGSPQGFPRSPTTYPGESFSREPPRLRLISTPPPHKPAEPPRMLHPQDAHRSLQLQSPHGLRRHLSFDSSLPAIRVSDSPKKLDEDFLKLYHKFVCQNKSSFFNRHPCRLCAGSAEAGGGPSSSAASSSSLAALALSPHRSLLRKRHRELDRDGHPRSKRHRDELCPSSPGSQRHGKEMLRRGLFFGAGTPAVFQEAWASRRADDFSGTGERPL